MGIKRPTNENIHIGNIFKHSSYDECGSGCSFYQVVGLRGKTLVELRGIRGESYVDESCQLGYGQVKVRPLPGQFWKDTEVMTVRVCSDDSDDGRHWLRERGETSRVFGTYYSQVLEGDLLAVEEQVVDGEDSAGFRQFLHHDGSFPSFFILSKT